MDYLFELGIEPIDIVAAIVGLAAVLFFAVLIIVRHVIDTRRNDRNDRDDAS